MPMAARPRKNNFEARGSRDTIDCEGIFYCEADYGIVSIPVIQELVAIFHHGHQLEILETKSLHDSMGTNQEIENRA